MCGIFGLVTKQNTYEKNKARSIVDDLLLLSESRGKDSSGVAFIKEGKIIVYKEPLSAHKFIREDKYKDLFNYEVDRYALIGHARMETNGSYSLSYNNQPVIKDGIVTIHNGIIVNDEQIWKKNKDLKREYQVDTEAFNSLLRKNIETNKNFLKGLKSTLRELKGSYAFAGLFEDYNKLLLVTNTGSLFTITDQTKSYLIFVSEKHFAEELIKRHFSATEAVEIKQVKAGTGVVVDLESLDATLFSIEKFSQSTEFSKREPKRKILEIGKIITEVPVPKHILKNRKSFKETEKLVFDEYERDKDLIKDLRRCTRCIIPETMPFIEFDDEGVCNLCRNYQKRETKGVEELEKLVSKYRRDNGEADCIVSFSGGRDSCYALHYAVKELGLKPLAYSYDWGMITDLGRRNQARMTGQLGVEHILISADIQKKREYIRKNVEAWLKDPQIGMIPLFMAGDKQYFYHLNKLQKETGIELVIYSGNSLEKTHFKYGFANVREKNNEKKTYDIGRLNSLKLLSYYAKNYIRNPKYWNSSLVDTMTAFVSSYAISKDYTYIFKYLPWSEKEIEKVLLGQYDWELSPDTTSSWRIGDGTASFYNYIYYVMTGLTENDTFRSNQIREGLISREEGYKLALEENKPRLESMLWYCDTIGLDSYKTIKTINSAKKIY